MPPTPILNPGVVNLMWDSDIVYNILKRYNLLPL